MANAKRKRKVAPHSSSAVKKTAAKRPIGISAKRKSVKKRIQKKHADVVSTITSPELIPAKRLLPQITIITPSFNQGKFIERTIKSVLSQNYPHLEYIVIDGGSTDETLDILRKYEKHLRWISEPDTGQSNAINKGFRMATGEIVAWLNSDDIYLPNALKTVGQYFAGHPNVMMVYGEGYIIDENNNRKRRFPFTEPKFDLWKLIYYSDYILQQSTFFRRSTFETIALLDENLHYGMDWDLFIRIGKRFSVEYIPEYLACIREHVEAKSSIGGRKRFRELVGIIRNHGVLRYPQSYFNYAWDAYGGFLRTNDDGSIGKITFKSKACDWIKVKLQKILALYQKRVEQGIYQDGWVGKKATVVLPNLHPEMSDQFLFLVGEAHSTNVPFELNICVNGALLIRSKLKQPGSFQVMAKISDLIPNSDCYQISIESSSTFVPKKLKISSDPRDLGFVLKSIAITRDLRADTASKEDTPANTRSLKSQQLYEDERKSNGDTEVATKELRNQASNTITLRKGMSLTIKLIVLASFIALAFWKMDISSMFGFLNVRIVLYIVLLQPLAFLCALALAKRYSVLLQNPEVEFRVVFKAIILSNGLNVILPARLSEVLKATYINEKTGYSVSKAFSAVVLERIGDVMILILLVLASIGTVLIQVNVLYISLLALFIVGALGALVVSEKAILRLADSIRFHFISRILKQFVTHAASSLRTRSFYLGQLFGVLSWMCSFILVVLLVFLIGSIKLGLSQIVILFTATTVGLLIPLLPGGIGTYEAAGIYVLQKFGYGFDEALVLSLVLHISQLVFFFVASLIIASSEHIGITTLIRKIRVLVDKNGEVDRSADLKSADANAAPAEFQNHSI
jgi:uncharacterized protein (TIRG00374 family)